jgi:hypothetical protein
VEIADIAARYSVGSSFAMMVAVRCSKYVAAAEAKRLTDAAKQLKEQAQALMISGEAGAEQTAPLTTEAPFRSLLGDPASSAGVGADAGAASS